MAISARIFTCFWFFIFKYECTGVRLVVGPVNYVASPSEIVRLPCEITEKGSTEIIWTYGPQTILSYDRQINILLDPKLRGRHSITPSFGNSFDLTIRDVRVIDIGMYTCGYISDKTVYSLQSAKLDVIQDATAQVYPHCYVDQSPDRISPYDSVDLNCDAGSTATASTKLTWSKHGATLISQVGEPYLSHHIVLTHDDYGVAFICNKTDLLTDQYKTCRIVPLIFAQKTSLTVMITPPVLEAQVGNEAVFTCNVQGLESTEQPRYSWSISNNELITSRRVQLQNEQKILKVINIQPSDDRSRFTCEVITDTRRRGSRDTILYVASPRPRVTIPSRTTTNYVPRRPTHPTHRPTLVYYNETTHTFEPNINGKDTQRTSIIGLRSGLAAAGVLALMCILVIAVKVTKRSQNNAAQSAEQDAVLQDAATIRDGSRFSFMQMVTRFSDNFSTSRSRRRPTAAPKKQRRRVRFAEQENHRKSEKDTNEPLYDPVAIEEENPKCNKRFFKKPKIFFEEGSVYKNITKNMSNNCSVKSDLCEHESHPVTCVCVHDDATEKMSLANPDGDNRRRTHPGNLEIIPKDNHLKQAKLQPTCEVELVYADLDFHEKTHESPTFMQVLLRLRESVYAEIRNSVN